MAWVSDDLQLLVTLEITTESCSLSIADNLMLKIDGNTIRVNRLGYDCCISTISAGKTFVCTIVAIDLRILSSLVVSSEILDLPSKPVHPHGQTIVICRANTRLCIMVRFGFFLFRFGYKKMQRPCKFWAMKLDSNGMLFVDYNVNDLTYHSDIDCIVSCW